MTPPLRPMGGMPPAQGGELGAHLAEVLAVSHPPAAPQLPLVGREEQPVPWSQASRPPLPATAGPPERDDDEDARPGPAPRCLCPEPRRGVRLVSVREPKTAVDGAPEVRQRLDQPSPEADRSRLVWAHLTTQGIGARDEAFPPAPARSLASRLALHEPPQPGRGLHSAESALRALPLPCLDRRLPELATLRAATQPWEQRRKASHTGVDGQCSPPDARIKRKRLSPQMQS